jgi:hypothetical protein
VEDVLGPVEGSATRLEVDEVRLHPFVAAFQVVEVGPSAGAQVVDGPHTAPLSHESLNQMGADEARAAGDDHQAGVILRHDPASPSIPWVLDGLASLPHPSAAGEHEGFAGVVAQVAPRNEGVASGGPARSTPPLRRRSGGSAPASPSPSRRRSSREIRRPRPTKAPLDPRAHLNDVIVSCQSRRKASWSWNTHLSSSRWTSPSIAGDRVGTEKLALEATRGKAGGRLLASSTPNPSVTSPIRARTRPLGPPFARNLAILTRLYSGQQAVRHLLTLANLRYAFLGWMAVVVVAFAVIGLIIAWDWLIWRRIPFARWRVSQLPPIEENIFREVARLRRLRRESDGQNASGS